MDVIPRHKIDYPAVQRRLETTLTYLPGLIGSVGRTPNNLMIVASNALDIVACASVVDPDSPQIRPALRLASRALAALFAAASALSFPLEVVVTEGAPVRYDFPPESSLVHPIRWLNAFFVAALCRDYAAIQTLADTPLDLLRASSTRCPEYTALFVDGIRGFLAGAPDTAARLLKAMAATDPERPDLMPDWALRIDVPKIELFFRYASGDAEAFAAALPQAVEHWRSYWTKLTDRDKSRNPDGFLALGLLGLAALAYDKKMPFEVESDYLPPALFQAWAD